MSGSDEPDRTTLGLSATLATDAARWSERAGVDPGEGEGTIVSARIPLPRTPGEVDRDG